MPSESLPASPAAESKNPTTSDSIVCTNSSAGSARTLRWFHRRCPQHPGWPLLAGTLPTLRVSQCNKVLLMSCHSSPQNGLATFVNWITLPLRSTLITRGFIATTDSSVPRPGIGILPHGVCHLSFPLPSRTRFSRSIPKPVLSSCRLYTDCRRDRKQVSSRLILEPMVVPSSDSVLRQ